MRVDTSNRQVFKIAAPIWLALIIPQINHMTNVAFLGRLGQFEMAANGIAGLYYLVMYMISHGLNNGMQILIARRAGETNYPGIGRLFGSGIWLGLVFAFLAIGVTAVLAPIIFASSLHDPQIQEAALSFIRIRMWGLPFLMMMGLANSFYIGTTNTRILAVTSVFMEFTNIGMDYALIFGKLGFPAMGLNGAAYASIIAECTGFVTAFAMLFILKYHKQFHLFQYLRPQFAAIRSTLTVAAPLIVQYLFAVGSWLVFFIFIEHLGQRPLAISNMMRSLFGILSVFIWALGSTANTMVSNLIGQGREFEVTGIIRKIAGYSLACVSVVCLVVNLFPHQLLAIYTPDATLIQEALPSVRMLTASILTTAVSSVVFSGVTGTGNTKVNLLIEFTAVILYLVYCEVVIEQWQKPLHWAWGSEFIYWITVLVLAAWYLKSGKWKGKQL
ncbi:MATE family efflux transporter [Chitinophaga horti]|uniref:Multidrug-efflux transporter n=1 Tax=Chitinophaga horti TaxID=2920382 RepID=A0ABY6J3K2_9BACT|nr:MATE family efflux transporter [Chitinophaga horti]UYQ94253.1 MATE family efflux transporter [Chitinophaga horti]